MTSSAGQSSRHECQGQRVQFGDASYSWSLGQWGGLPEQGGACDRLDGWGGQNVDRRSWGIVCTLGQVACGEGGKRRRAGVPGFSFHALEETYSLQPCAGCWEHSKRTAQKAG